MPLLLKTLLAILTIFKFLPIIVARQAQLLKVGANKEGLEGVKVI